MIHWLIYVGLAFTSFTWVPGQADPAREPKMAVAVLFALLIGMYALWKGKIKAFSNKFAIALIFYIFIAYHLAPKPDLLYFGIRSARFWSWEPMFYSVVFLLFLVAVSSLNFTKKKIDGLFLAMIRCGVVMAALVCLQSLHIMQFFEHRFGTYGNMGGTLGHPTLIAPYLGIILPLALYKRKYIASALLIYSILATRSDVGLAGFLASMIFYIATKSKKLFITLSLITVLSASSFAVIYTTNISVRQAMPDNERFLTWTNAIQDLRNPVMKDSNGEKSKKVYTVTGIGLGSFKYLYHAIHHNGFLYAHNEYVQCAWAIGILGFILFMCALLYVFKQNFSIKRVFKEKETRYKRALMASLICSCICAGGIFIWQFGTTLFFTLIIFGLLHNSYNETIGD